MRFLFHFIKVLLITVFNISSKHKVNLITEYIFLTRLFKIFHLTFFYLDLKGAQTKCSQHFRVLKRYFLAAMKQWGKQWKTMNYITSLSSLLVKKFDLSGFTLSCTRILISLVLRKLLTPFPHSGKGIFFRCLSKDAIVIYFK